MVETYKRRVIYIILCWYSERSLSTTHCVNEKLVAIADDCARLDHTYSLRPLFYKPLPFLLGITRLKILYCFDLRLTFICVGENAIVHKSYIFDHTEILEAFWFLDTSDSITLYSNLVKTQASLETCG